MFRASAAGSAPSASPAKAKALRDARRVDRARMLLAGRSRVDCGARRRERDRARPTPRRARRTRRAAPIARRRASAGFAKLAYRSPRCAPSAVRRRRIVAPARATTRLPPAMPSVRTSTVRSIVRWPPIRAGRICGVPLRITEQSELVPPTSMKMPSVTFSCRSAPATPAAGPESNVRIGRRSISRDVHHAAVAAHDHQRRGDARVGDGLRGHPRGVHHPRQNRGIERRGPRTRAQAVHGADVVTARRCEAALPGARDRRFLALRTIDGERGARRDRFDVFVSAAVEHGVIVARDAEKTRRERVARAERNRREAHRMPEQACKRTIGDRQHRDRREIAFEQRVRRLRRRMRDERDRVGIDAGLAEQALHPLHDPRGDALRRVVA